MATLLLLSGMSGWRLPWPFQAKPQATLQRNRWAEFHCVLPLDLKGERVLSALSCAVSRDGHGAEISRSSLILHLYLLR